MSRIHLFSLVLGAVVSTATLSFADDPYSVSSGPQATTHRNDGGQPQRPQQDIRVTDPNTFSNRPVVPPPAPPTSRPDNQNFNLHESGEGWHPNRP